MNDSDTIVINIIVFTGLVVAFLLGGFLFYKMSNYQMLSKACIEYHLAHYDSDGQFVLDSLPKGDSK